ncbi:hypothetical protein [Methanobrevibacter sp.]
MKKTLKILGILSFSAFLILLVLFFENFNDNIISLKASVIEISIEQGSIDEPIFGDSEADFENFVKVSNMTYNEAIDVKENPEDYLFIKYTIEMKNVGDVELVLKDLGQLENKDIWILNELDGYFPISPQDTDIVNVCLVGKNCDENINSRFNIPLVFDISYEGIFSYLENTITIWVS